MKNIFTTTALVATLALGATAANAFEIGGVRIGNPFDRSTWWDGSTAEAGDTIVINFADPDFWMSFPDPDKHSFVHTAMSDPASWAQMMTPETYINMMNVETWAKWLDTDSYEVLLDPQTYAYWAQPGAYGHLVELEFYTERFNPLAYGEMADAALGNFGVELNDITAALHLSDLFGTGDVMTVETAPAETLEN
ncbi:MAG: hypothetical protein V3U96_11605 [Paracoccaceae bacterium]